MIDPQAREIDLAAGDCSGRVDKSDHGEPCDGFSRAGLADHAQHRALGDVERDAIDCAQPRAAGSKLHLKVAYAENGIGHRSFGLSASRSQSPSRLMDRMRAASAMPGKATIHHSPANR